MAGVRVGFAAFLDNLGGAALFGKLRWPGAPTEMIDSRTPEEYLASGEFDETVEKYESAVQAWKRNRAVRQPAASPVIEGEHALYR